jgi:hypothetical protein
MIARSRPPRSWVDRRDRFRGHLKAMGKDDRLRKAELAGYGLLSGDDAEEIWGRLELPSTLEFDGREWVLYRRDFDLNPTGHEVLGDAGLDPARAFAALKELDPEQVQDWRL